MKIVTFEDIKKRGKGREMSDIDEDSDIEDIKKRGKGREMSEMKIVIEDQVRDIERYIKTRRGKRK